MQLTTFVFLTLLAFFAWRGYQKGFIGSLTRILSWIVAYPATLIFTPSVADILINHTSLSGVIVYFVAGGGIFLVVSLAVSMLLTSCGKIMPENKVTDTGSKIGGIGVGIFVGALTGLVVVYVLGLVLPPQSPSLIESPMAKQKAITPTKTAIADDSDKIAVPELRDLQRAKDSFIEASAKKLMGAAASIAVDLVLEDKTTSQVTKAFMQDPQTMLGHVQHMTNNGQIQALIADENIQSLLTTGDTHALIRNPEFKALIENPSMQALMAQSDVSNDVGAQAAAEKMVFAWNRIQLIKHDPRVIAIINDPEFQQQLNSDNKLALMMNPKLNQLTQIILSQDTRTTNGLGNSELGGSNKNRANNEVTEGQESTQIYRWTDENGQVHFSDKQEKPIKKP